MAYLNFLDNIGLVENKENCIQNIADQANISVEELDIAGINKYHEVVENSKRYFNGNLMEESGESNMSKYLWVDTGYRKNGEYPIYCSFVKRMGWEGGFIGTEHYLANKLGIFIENLKEHSTPNVPYSSIVQSSVVALAVPTYSDIKPGSKYATTEFCKEVYSRLLMTDHWDISPKALTGYFLALASRVSVVYRKNGRNSNCYIVNSEATLLVVNSSLVDKFGNDMHILFKYRNGELFEPSFIESKLSLVKIGFSREDTSKDLEPVTFYNSIEDIIFNGKFDDFDLANSRRLEHIIVERRDRFPLEVQALSDSILCSKLIQAVRQGVHISKCDKRYIVPMYSIARDCIQYMFPFHVANDMSEAPELVIIVGKHDGFYDVMTIIPLVEAFINQKTLSPYSDSWILDPDETSK